MSVNVGTNPQSLAMGVVGGKTYVFVLTGGSAPALWSVDVTDGDKHRLPTGDGRHGQPSRRIGDRAFDSLGIGMVILCWQSRHAFQLNHAEADRKRDHVAGSSRQRCGGHRERHRCDRQCRSAECRRHPRRGESGNRYGHAGSIRGDNSPPGRNGSRDHGQRISRLPAGWRFALHLIHSPLIFRETTKPPAHNRGRFLSYYLGTEVLFLF